MIKQMRALAAKAIGGAAVTSRPLALVGPSLGSFSGYGSDAKEDVSQGAVLSLSAVWACVNLIAGTISTLPVGVYRRDGVTRVAVDGHPLNRLLQVSPNYDQTPIDLLDFWQSSLEFWGNAYAEKVMEGGQLVALNPVRPDLVTVQRLPSGDLEYRWTEDGRRRVKLDREMLHVRGPGGNPLGGWSTLHYARNTFGIARAAERAAGATFANSLRPSGLLRFKEWLTADQEQIARNMIASNVGAANAGKPQIIPGGAEYEAVSINPADAQMIETRQFSIEDICRFFGVPPHMVGHTSGASNWGTGIEQQTLGFVKFTLRRRIRRIEQAMDKQLLTAADRAAGLFVSFNLEGLLRGDSAGRAKFYEVMTRIGLMTINEGRALENLPPVPGGDVVRIQSQNQPIEQSDTATIGE